MRSAAWEELLAEVDLSYIVCSVTPAPGSTPEGIWRTLYREMVMTQAVRALLPASPDLDTMPFVTASAWRRAEAVEALGPRWDAEGRCFVVDQAVE
jgi:hypothetical protein